MKTSLPWESGRDTPHYNVLEDCRSLDTFLQCTVSVPGPWTPPTVEVSLHNIGTWETPHAVLNNCIDEGTGALGHMYPECLIVQYSMTTKLCVQIISKYKFTILGMVPLQ